MEIDLLKLAIVAVIIMIPMVPTLWAIVDIPRRRFPSTKSKVIWFAVVSALPCFGALLYLFLARRHTSLIETDRGNGPQAT